MDEKTRQLSHTDRENEVLTVTRVNGPCYHQYSVGGVFTGMEWAPVPFLVQGGCRLAYTMAILQEETPICHPRRHDVRPCHPPIAGESETDPAEGAGVDFPHDFLMERKDASSV